MKVSVLMAVYNAETTIQRAMNSLLGQSYQNIEIIIIDDGCSDKTIDLIHAYDDSRIRIIKNPTNMGQIRSLNHGIEYCTGELIARMDADDISLPKRFELQVEAFLEDPELAIVSTNGYKIFPDGSQRRLVTPPSSPDALRILSMYKSPLHHISVMIRADLLTGDFRFDENIMISTDWDLWSRFILANHRIKVLPDHCFKFLVDNSTYGAANKSTQIAEDRVLVAQNVRHFTGKILSPTETQKVLDVHYPADIGLNEYSRQILFWFEILKQYKPISRIDYIRMLIFELSVVLAKAARLFFRRILS